MEMRSTERDSAAATDAERLREGPLSTADEETGLTSGQLLVQHARDTAPRGKWLWGVVALTAAAFFLGLLLPGRLSHVAPPGALAAAGGAAAAAGAVLAAPLSFLVVGDWGRQGAFNQSIVARSMGVVGERLGVNFVISAGDNFYEQGLVSVHDPLFTQSFTDIYTANSLQKLWYAVLGNHDYVTVAEAQLDPNLKMRDPRWHCGRQYQIKRSLCSAAQKGPCGDEIEFFFIDTNPFVNEYWDERRLNFTGLPPRGVVVQDTLQTLEASLLASNATWKVVVGHHPIRSVGDHGDTVELVQFLLPVLEKARIDLYMNGHDHCLQYIKRDDSPIPLVTSGAGSKAYRPQRKAAPDEGLQFDHNGQGFVSASVTPAWLHIDFHDLHGDVLYKLHLDK